jgi:hypothetical protein
MFAQQSAGRPAPGLASNRLQNGKLGSHPPTNYLINRDMIVADFHFNQEMRLPLQRRGCLVPLPETRLLKRYKLELANNNNHHKLR